MSCRAVVVCVVRCVFALVELFPSWYSSIRWAGMGSMKGGWMASCGVDVFGVSLLGSPILGRSKIRAL